MDFWTAPLTPLSSTKNQTNVINNLKPPNHRWCRCNGQKCLWNSEYNKRLEGSEISAKSSTITKNAYKYPFWIVAFIRHIDHIKQKKPEKDQKKFKKPFLLLMEMNFNFYGINKFKKINLKWKKIQNSIKIRRQNSIKKEHTRLHELKKRFRVMADRE